VLLISSELIEVLKLSHRAYVMREGRVVAELTGEGLTEAQALQAFFGHELPPSALPNPIPEAAHVR
jgi:ABC-type sugar transport system ATPase subunit